MKYGMILGKAVVVLMVAALLMVGLSSVSLAKNQALVDKGVESMVKAKDAGKQAVGTIEKGQQMYVKIAQEKGFANDVAQGNKTIDDGVNQARQGFASLDQGQKEYQLAKGKNQQAANAGMEKMMEGGRMFQNALKVIQDGVKMNNDVLRAKGLASQMEAPSVTILKGTESGLTAIRQFLKGQKLVMENK
jgi:aldehyde:ferredoxin oxidoreductase